MFIHIRLSLELSCSYVQLLDAEALNGMESEMRFGSSALPFFLDELGCSGSESNLLDCLPQHNCGSSNENAGVQCLRKGEFCHS